MTPEEKVALAMQVAKGFAGDIAIAQRVHFEMQEKLARLLAGLNEPTLAGEIDGEQ